MALFENLGVPLKTERGNRVFPESDCSRDIVDALIRYMDSTGVRVIQDSALKLRIEDGAVTGVFTRGGVIDCGAAVICTGGMSYPATGSTGAGYRFAREAGHTVCPCRPSLVPLESPDAYCAEMQGFSLKNVRLSAFEDDKLVIDTEKCNYCGRCAKSCPVDAWDVNEAYIVSFGGTFGNHISKGQEFLPLITSEEQLFRVTDAAIQFFDDHANPGERFKFTIDRVGAEKLQEVLKGAYNG